jgi:hypothetical protein
MLKSAGSEGRGVTAKVADFGAPLWKGGAVPVNVARWIKLLLPQPRARRCPVPLTSALTPPRALALAPTRKGLAVKMDHAETHMSNTFQGTMVRVRAGAEPPPVGRKAPCPRCFVRPGYASRCPVLPWLNPSPLPHPSPPAPPRPPHPPSDPHGPGDHDARPHQQGRRRVRRKWPRAAARVAAGPGRQTTAAARCLAGPAAHACELR